MDAQKLIEAARNISTNGAVDPVKIETTGRGVWFLATCVCSAIAGALTYMGGYFTDEEARALETKVTEELREFREHELAQDEQLIEIAKHLGAKVVLQPTTQPTTSKTR
jgi:hypothetical protein